jgi:hypothetical protein
MRAANTAPGTYADHVIVLGAGLYSFFSTDPSAPDGATALPLVTGGGTIMGAGAQQTEILRNLAGASPLRLFEVAPGGVLVLADLAVEGGILRASTNLVGAGIKSSGTLALYRTIVRWNVGEGIWSAGFVGIVGGNIYGNSLFGYEATGLVVARGIASVQDSFIWWNSSGSTSDGAGITVREGASLNIRGSTISHNVTGGTGGGIANGGLGFAGGTVTIADSFIGFNIGTGGIFNRGTMEIVNSTLHGNEWGGAPPGIALTDRPTGRLLLTNSTVVHVPTPTTRTPLEGLRVDAGGVLLLQNTILWGGSIRSFLRKPPCALRDFPRLPLH